MISDKEKVANLRLRVLPSITTCIINSIIEKDKKKFVETLLYFYYSETYQRLYEELLKSSNPSQVDCLPFKKMFIDELKSTSKFKDAIPFQINYKVLNELTLDERGRRKDCYIHRSSGIIISYSNLVYQIEEYGFYHGLSALEVLSLAKNKDYQNKYLEARTRDCLAWQVSDIVDSIIEEDKKKFVDTMLRFYNSVTFQSLYQTLYYEILASKNPSKVDYLPFKKMFVDEVKNTPEYLDPMPFQMDYKVLDELDWGDYYTRADYIHNLPYFIEIYGTYKGLNSQEVITLFKKYDILRWLISNIDFLCHYTSNSRIINMIDESLEYEDPSFHLEDINDLDDGGSSLEVYGFLNLVLL